MATTTKITKRQKYEMLKAYVADNEMLTEFLDHEIELLTNKSSKGSTKKIAEQEAFMDVIRDVLAECGEEGKTCAEILADERIIGFAWADNKATSSSRLTAYLTKMGEPTDEHPERLGDVKKVVVKKTPYFSLA